MADAFAHCEALVRAADKDRFLATLFAPAQRRAALYALYAFNIEIARVRELVREPLAGEIRLQWWTDALAGAGAGEVAANPVAAAVLSTIKQYRLPLELLDHMIEARRFDLYDEPMQRLEDLEDYGRKTSSGLIALAAHALSDVPESHIEPIALAAGVGQAITGLLLAFPRHAARGQLYLPGEVLDRNGVQQADIAAGRATPQLRLAFGELRVRARQRLAQAAALVAQVPPAILPALLPAAVADAVLDRMESNSFDPFRPIEIPQWRRQWLLWRAARRPSRMFRSA